MNLKNIVILFFVYWSSGCAFLHHAQVGTIDNRQNEQETSEKFDIKVSELGVDVNEAGRLTRSSDTAAVISAFQVGPRTGNPVFDEKYAENIIEEIYKKCPSGNVKNLISVRETMEYPVISGEIVKISCECVTQPKKEMK